MKIYKQENIATLKQNHSLKIMIWINSYNDKSY